MRRRARPLAVILLAAGAQLAGCSSFERDWQALADSAPDAPGLEGRWDGRWLSDVNGHTGGLRCIVEKDHDGLLQARYRATYAGWLSFEYAMPMTVRQDGDTYRFSAEADLGWLAGGIYEYDGTVVGDEFASTYRCERDHGTFQMRRVREAPQ